MAIFIYRQQIKAKKSPCFHFHFQIAWGLQLRHELAVDPEIVKHDVAHLTDDVVDVLVTVLAFGHAIPLAVLEGDVVDIALIVKAIEEDAVLRFLAGDVLEVHVADNRIVAALALLVRLVVEVDAEDGFAALADGDVADKDILDDAAAAGVGLDADDAVEVRRIHDAILDVEIAIAARDL